MNTAEHNPGQHSFESSSDFTQIRKFYEGKKHHARETKGNYKDTSGLRRERIAEQERLNTGRQWFYKSLVVKEDAEVAAECLRI